jgi:hypothetical protein
MGPADKNASEDEKDRLNHHGTGDRDILDRAIAWTGLYLADLIDNIHTFHHIPKDRVLCVKEVVVYKVDEELGSPGIRTGIRHRDGTAVVPVFWSELILDLISGIAHAGARRIATLKHKPVDDPVEDHAVIEAFFHERFEIACGYGHSGIESNGNVSHVRLEPDQFLFLC